MLYIVLPLFALSFLFTLFRFYRMRSETRRMIDRHPMARNAVFVIRNRVWFTDGHTITSRAPVGAFILTHDVLLFYVAPSPNAHRMSMGSNSGISKNINLTDIKSVEIMPQGSGSAYDDITIVMQDDSRGIFSIGDRINKNTGKRPRAELIEHIRRIAPRIIVTGEERRF